MKYETEDIIPVVIMGNLKDLTTQKAKSKVYKKLALDEVQCLYSKGANIFPDLFCFVLITLNNLVWSANLAISFMHQIIYEKGKNTDSNTDP